MRIKKIMGFVLVTALSFNLSLGTFAADAQPSADVGSKVATSIDLNKYFYDLIFIQSKKSPYHQKVTYALLNDITLYHNTKIPNAKTVAEKNSLKAYIIKKIQNFKKTHSGEISKRGIEILDIRIEQIKMIK